VNAYEIIKDPHLDDKIRKEGSHKVLGFDGLIAMDSGGFQFIRRHILNIEPASILKLYAESRPDYGVILDHPIGPGISEYQRRKRQALTLRNSEVMVKEHRSQNPVLIPVIHGQSVKSAKWYLKKLLSIADFPVLGIGSLVPSVFNMKGALRTHTAFRMLSYIRRALPEKLLHVFGIASTLSMHLMFYAGIDSVDSSAWRLKAAYGAIQLPGVGDRYITARVRHKEYRDLSAEEMNLLDECRCPACRKGTTNSLRTSFSARALHNAWVYQREVQLARKLIKGGEYDNYVEGVLKRSSRFARLFELVKRYRLSS